MKFIEIDQDTAKNTVFDGNTKFLTVDTSAVKLNSDIDGTSGIGDTTTYTYAGLEVLYSLDSGVANANRAAMPYDIFAAYLSGRVLKDGTDYY